MCIRDSINTAKDLIDQIMEYGYVKGRIDLGFTTVDVSNAQIAMMYRLSSTGVYIDDVTEGSNAQSTGFRSGDRIVSFNGAEILSLIHIWVMWWSYTMPPSEQLGIYTPVRA